jgi:hypothetical protein
MTYPYPSIASPLIPISYPLIPLFRINGTHSVYWWCQFMRDLVHYKGRGVQCWLERKLT